MDRIEAQQKNSIWAVFLEPVFSRRLAYASVAMMLLMGFVLMTENQEPEFGEIALDSPAPIVMNENEPAPVLGAPVSTTASVAMRRRVDALHAQPVSLMGAEEGRDAVMVDLVSFEQ